MKARHQTSCSSQCRSLAARNVSHSTRPERWWAIVTATTVGYGDLSPVTLEGRIIAVLLMLTGIGVIGIFTANVASLFFEQEASGDQQHIERRLQAIEAKLDALPRLGRDRES